MNALTISFVLVRLAAVFLFVRAIQGLATFSFVLTGDSQIATFGAVTLTFMVLLPGTIALVLWIYPEKVTGAQQTSAKSEGSISAEQILMLGISLIGIYMAVYGIVELVQIETAHGLQWHLADEAGLPHERLDDGLIAKRAASFAQVFMAFGLLLGRRGLSKLLIKAKYAGVRKGSADKLD